MVIVEMNVTKREDLGKQANNKIRKSGLVPAVVYGKNKENVNISVDPKELKKLLSSTVARENSIISISIDGDKEKRKVLLKEAHLDTLTSAPLHLENIPNEIRIDISDLNIGDTLFVKDLPVEEGVTVLSNPESTTISVLAPRIVTEEVEAEEGEEGEEGEEATEGEEAKEESDK